MQRRPRVGVAVIIIKKDKVLVGQRKVRLGKGTWAFPGGHLEFGEKPQNGAIREVLEETGLNVQNLKRFSYTSDVFSNLSLHYITLFFTADYVSGTEKIMEPKKCREWRWVRWNELPKPYFLPLENLLNQNLNPFSKTSLKIE